jgi:hypothetical protein
LHHPFDLCAFTAVNDEDPIDTGPPASRFDEQRNVENHRTSGRGFRLAITLDTDHGVEDGFESAFRSSIGKDQLSHANPIQRTIGVNDGGAKQSTNCIDGSTAREHQRTRNRVGVDQGRSELHEFTRNGALAAANASCEANAQAGCGSHEDVAGASGPA